MKHIINFICAVCFLGFSSVALAQEESVAGILHSDSIEIEQLKQFGFCTTNGNAVTLLPTGEEKFQDLFEFVRNARSFIHMEYFNFRNDSINALLINLLHEKAKQGVEVRVIYDAFGNSSNNQPIHREQHDSIVALGIMLQKFDPIRFPWVNHIFPRDHRKIVVIDGEHAYTGGMNVADYYIEGLEGIGPWRDMHLRVEGPAVNDLHDIFIDMWAKQTGQLLTGARYLPVQPYKGNAKITVIDRKSKISPKAIRQLYISMLDNAKKSVKIINPYFVPTHSVRKAIERAVQRGVDVQIMVSEKSDIPLTPDATHYAAYQLAKKGAKVYMFQNGFHHTKVMMIDDAFCTVGSANLNSRSLRYDFEVNVAIFHQPTTQQLIEMFERDKMDSQVLDKDKWNKKSFWKKRVAWFAHLLTPFL